MKDDNLTSHCYKVGILERSRHVLVDILPEEVEFKNHSTMTDIPMPSKQYLALRAACCKVAAMSGAAEYLNDLDREGEDTFVLASDGGSFGVLENNIWRALYSRGDNAIACF